MGLETMMEPFNSLRAPVFAKNGLACSSQPLAAALGAEILRAGGNTADAAVAMAAMVNITEPMRLNSVAIAWCSCIGMASFSDLTPAAARVRA